MRKLAPRIVVAVGLLLTCAPAFADPAGDAAAVDLSKPPKIYTVNAAVPGKDGVKRMAILRGLDKLTGQAAIIDAPIGVPVRYATLTITAEYCYSTPPSETPETTAFLTIVDRRPDKPAKQAFSGWMWASSPSLNAMQHPLYDVWVMSCRTNQPGQEGPPVEASAPVKPVSPNAKAAEAPIVLPEGAGQ